MQRFVRGRKLCVNSGSQFWDSLDEDPESDKAGEASNSGQPDTPPEIVTYEHNGWQKHIVVVEGRSLLRECFAFYLSTLYDANIDSFENVADMLHKEPVDQLDLVVVGWHGNSRALMLGQLSKLCRECGSCPVIIMQDTCDYGTVSDALRAGARGVVPTSLSTDVAAEAIDLVMAGGSYIPEEHLMTPQESQPRGIGGIQLTPREEQVLALLRVGKQNKQIAFSLGLSEGTVKVHLHNLMKKLGTSNRTQTIMASTERMAV